MDCDFIWGYINTTAVIYENIRPSLRVLPDNNLSREDVPLVSLRPSEVGSTGNIYIYQNSSLLSLSSVLVCTSTSRFGSLGVFSVVHILML